MKKILFIIILLFFLCLLLTPAIFTEAREPKLEIDYPDIPEVPTPSIKGGVPNYVKYIFNFAIWISGFIALAVLIYAGLKYLTSAGNIERISDAKNQITAAILGIVILFGSYLILVNINPQLISFNLGDIKPILSTLEPGVLLCTEKIDYLGKDGIRIFNELRESAEGKSIAEQNFTQEMLEEILEKVRGKCWYSASSGPIPKEFDNKATVVYLIPGETTKYGAIIYDKNNFTGKSDLLHTLKTEVARYHITLHPSSVRVFVINDEPSLDWYVKIYQLKDYNRAEPTAKEKTYTLEGGVKKCHDGLICSEGGSCDFPFQAPWFGLNYYFQSVETEGSLIIVFFKKGDCSADWTTDTEIYVLVQSDSNLNDNGPMDQWCNQFGNDLPCAESMTIFSADML